MKRFNRVHTKKLNKSFLRIKYLSDVYKFRHRIFAIFGHMFAILK